MPLGLTLGGASERCLASRWLGNRLGIGDLFFGLFRQAKGLEVGDLVRVRSAALEQLRLHAGIRHRGFQISDAAAADDFFHLSILDLGWIGKRVTARERCHPFSRYLVMRTSD